MYDGFVNISVILYINPIKGQTSVQKILLKLNPSRAINMPSCKRRWEKKTYVKDKTLTIEGGPEFVL